VARSQPLHKLSGSPLFGAVDLLMVPCGTEGMAVSVIPAKAGIQKCGYVNFAKPLDSHLRGNDGGVHCYVLVGFIRPRHSKSTAPFGVMTGWRSATLFRELETCSWDGAPSRSKLGRASVERQSKARVAVPQKRKSTTPAASRGSRVGGGLPSGRTGFVFSVCRLISRRCHNIPS